MGERGPFPKKGEHGDSREELVECRRVPKKRERTSLFTEEKGKERILPFGEEGKKGGTVPLCAGR